MPLKLMYITNRPDVALIAENAGVDRIFVDMEYIGKAARQGGMDSVQNHHTVEDVRKLRSVLTKAQLLVRVNPIHEESEIFGSSEEEIDQVIEAGCGYCDVAVFQNGGGSEKISFRGEWKNADYAAFGDAGSGNLFR